MWRSRRRKDLPMTANKFLLALVVLLIWLEPKSGAQIHALDYDTPAYLDFEFRDMQVDEDDSAVLINVYRFGDFRQVTRVDFATEELTAKEGQDYKGTGGTITFQTG